MRLVAFSTDTVHHPGGGFATRPGPKEIAELLDKTLKECKILDITKKLLALNPTIRKSGQELLSSISIL